MRKLTALEAFAQDGSPKPSMAILSAFLGGPASCFSLRTKASAVSSAGRATSGVRRAHKYPPLTTASSILSNNRLYTSSVAVEVEARLPTSIRFKRALSWAESDRVELRSNREQYTSLCPAGVAAVETGD